MMHHSVLLNKADKFLRDGLAASSRTTYAAGQGRYIHFCNTAKVPATPATEYTLILFITHLASTNISYATIKVYLSAIRHMHVYRGWHNHFNQQLTPRLQLILRGIRKHQSSTHVPRVRLPITVQILHSIRRLLSQKPKSYATTMLWAACSLAFFAFLRVSEFTIPQEGLYDPSCHLSLQDIAVDIRDTPRLMQVDLKQSKTDPFRQGVTLYLGATDSTICPIKAVLSYLAIRGGHAGPLFLSQSGKGLTRHMFTTELDSLLAELNLNKHHYNSHSFRIGAATTAMQAKIPETHIQMLGRWRSDAYQRYIKTPPSELAKLSKMLATPIN